MRLPRREKWIKRKENMKTLVKRAQRIGQEKSEEARASETTRNMMRDNVVTNWKRR